jgi:hypothetical protein
LNSFPEQHSNNQLKAKCNLNKKVWNVGSEKLQIPKAKTELFKKTCTYSGPKLWNELPFSIRQASSHNAFKTKVKSLILNEDVP